MAFPIATATADARAVIEARVKDCWVTDCGQTEETIRWGNAVTDPPGNTKYLKVSVLMGSSESATYATSGAEDWKFGVIQFDIYGPKNAGDKPLLTIGDKFKAKFQRQHADGVLYRGKNGQGCDGPREIPDAARTRVMLRMPVRYLEQLA